MKKYLAIFMSLLIFIGVFASVNSYAHLWDGYRISADGKYKYRLINDDCAELCHLEGNGNAYDGVIEVPSEIDGYKITTISEFVFEGSRLDYLNIDKVILPNTVTTIRNCAFAGLTEEEMEEEGLDQSLYEVVLPESLVYIGDRAFANCLYLKEINIPKSVVYIGYSAFDNCDSLEEVKIPGNVSYLSEKAFANCDNLKKAEIGRGIKSITYGIFYNCPQLNNIISYDTVSSVLAYDAAVPFGGYINKHGKEKFNKNLTFDIYEECGLIYENFPAYCDEYKMKCNYFLKEENKNEIVLSPGYILGLKFANNKIANWKSSNPRIVGVTPEGEMTTLKKGKAKLTATFEDGTSYERDIQVSHDPRIIKTSDDVIEVKKGKVIKVVLFGKVNNIKNTYTNTKRAKIISNRSAENLKIRGLKKGTTTLKIKVNGVKTLKLKVKVK